MSRKLVKPIRTYERKKLKEIIPQRRVDDLVSNSISRDESVPLTERSNEIEHFLHDPFDTTFDRLLKNARIPPKLPKADNDSVTFDSTNTSFERSKEKSSEQKSRSFSIQLFSNGKKTRRKRKPLFTASRKGKVKLHSSGTFKANKSKPRNKKKGNNATSIVLSIDSSNVDFGGNISDVMSKRNQKKRKSVAKKNNVKRRKRDNNTTNVVPSNYIETKQCSIHLDKLSILEYSNKMNQIKKETDQSQYDDNQMKNSNLEYNDSSVKHCFVRVERLKTESYIKQTSLENKYENNNSDANMKNCSVNLERIKETWYLKPRSTEIIISSTPIGSRLKSTTYAIRVSPILMNYSEKSDGLIKDDNENSNDKYICLESEYAVSCPKLKTKMNEYKDEHRLSSSCLTNTLDISTRNSKQNRSRINEISTAFNQKNSMQNISEHKQNETSSSLILTGKDEIVEPNNRYLRFSVDPNASPSLFNDSCSNIEGSLHLDNMESVCTGILEVNNSNSNKSYAQSNESSKNLSLSNTDKYPTVDETQKELGQSLVATSSNIQLLSNLSSDNSSLETYKINDISEATDSIEQSMLNETKPLNVNNSLTRSIERFSELSPCVVLKRLQDPVRITKRRAYKKWNFNLYDIVEDNSGSINLDKVDEVGTKSKSRETMSLQKLQPEEIRATESANMNGLDEFIYLKPGKSWARSISILNNVRNGSDLEKLSIGKGKKWRRSVQDILNMQKQGSIHSCIKKSASDKQLPEEINNKSEYGVVTGKGRTTDSTSVGRVSRKISVRVVPMRKSVKSIEDAQFLEVYGIVPVRSQRFTLINNPRRSSCNIQIDNADGQIIEEHAGLTAKEVILQRCSQKNYISFSTYFTDSYLEHCRKIGEGVYGEVFLYEDEGKRSVIKIIPIEGNDYVNGEPQKKFHEILSEIVIAMELHNLRFNSKYNTDGFVEVKDIKCIVGKYPEKLIELWNIYDEEKCSDNDCPSMFRDDQLYIVLELGHGGQDLEAFVFNTADEAHVLFVQAALALAVAEEAFEFEHRDLHWGNILISHTSEPGVYYKLGDKKIELMSKGVKVSIIDFTLSRVTYQGCSIFNDLSSDPTLFTAQGEYQFEIYRLMRDKVKNNWHKFEPYTNILWLHYTLDKMITEVRYRKRNVKIHKNGIIKLKELKNEILSYNSAFDFVTNCDKVSNLLCIDTRSEVTIV